MTALRALGRRLAGCRPLLFAYALAVLVFGDLDPIPADDEQVQP